MPVVMLKSVGPIWNLSGTKPWNLSGTKPWNLSCLAASGIDLDKWIQRAHSKPCTSCKWVESGKFLFEVTMTRALTPLSPQMSFTSMSINLCIVQMNYLTSCWFQLFILLTWPVSRVIDGRFKAASTFDSVRRTYSLGVNPSGAHFHPVLLFITNLKKAYQLAYAWHTVLQQTNVALVPEDISEFSNFFRSPGASLISFRWSSLSSTQIHRKMDSERKNCC